MTVIGLDALRKLSKKEEETYFYLSGEVGFVNLGYDFFPYFAYVTYDDTAVIYDDLQVLYRRMDEIRDRILSAGKYGISDEAVRKAVEQFDSFDVRYSSMEVLSEETNPTIFFEVYEP